MNKRKTKRIVVNGEVMNGKPIIKGTRITVEHVLRLLADGYSADDVLREYPHLTRDDVVAALEFGAERVAEEKIFPRAKFHYA